LIEDRIYSALYSMSSEQQSIDSLTLSKLTI